MSRKRKNDDNNDNTFENKRQNIVDWNDMISASSVRNYILNDPLLDWLKYYSINKINDIPMPKNTGNFTKYQSNKSNILTFNNFIMEQGNIFEKIVFDKLKERIQNTDIKMVQVSFNNESQSYQKYIDTINYMKAGVDIIYQGVLHDYKKHLYGVPDLLVRSDKFYSIFNKNIIYPHYKSKINYHYVVVDIKHSSIFLNCNRTFIKDINSIPAYKGQILIYNKILSEFLGYIPQYGFILSKKIIYTKNNICYNCDNFMENISIIDYKGVDKNYNYLTNRAIEWVRIMRTEGHTWRLLPNPTVLELYPNMKNDKDDNYRTIKVELAEKINEITNIWWCSYKKREIAHSKKVFSWTDKKFSAELIEIKDTKIAATLNNILKINRNNREIIRTTELVKNNDWRYTDNSIMEFYIDFETLNGNIGQVEVDGNNIIFMISIGWEHNNNWECKTFMINKYDDNDELNIINNMWDFIINKMEELNKTDYRLIHWSNAEITFYNKFLLKHPFNALINSRTFKSFDLYQLFLDNNIVIKGALNFSLKTIANAMHKNRLITTCWDKNSSCNNGLQAMFLAYNLYKNNEFVDENNNIMKEIIRYNIIDCKVMREILSYLRNNC